MAEAAIEQGADQIGVAAADIGVAHGFAQAALRYIGALWHK